MDRDLVRWLGEHASAGWHKWYGLVLGSAFGVLVATRICSLLGVEGRARLIMAGIVVVGVVVWWSISLRVPRARRGNVGFAVALSYESRGQEGRLRSDFVQTLRELLQVGHTRHAVDVVIVPDWAARNIETVEQARALLAKARCHYLIYGRARERVLYTRETHVLDLRGLVRHGQLDSQNKGMFEREFSELFPKQLLVAKENDLFTLSFTAEWMDVCARYIVGVASFLSGDFRYALELLKGLEERLSNSDHLPEPIERIHARLPLRVANVLSVWAQSAAHIYRRTRDKRVLAESEPILEELSRYSYESYAATLHRAMCAFVLRRDCGAALKILKACEAEPDSTWRYSKGFLLAYKGDLSAAWDCYRPAFYSPPSDPSVPLQAEEFVHLVLEEEPSKAQLLFVAGMINLKGKIDYQAARRDLQLFLDSPAANGFPQQEEIARKWLGDIQAHADQHEWVP